MTMKFSTGLRTAVIGTGGGLSTVFANGVIEIYTGAQPATADAAVTGTLLGTVTLASGAFTPGSATNGLTWATAVAGVASKTGVWSFNGIATGTAGWFRFKGNGVDAGGVSTSLARMDGALASSGGDMQIANISIVSGSPNTVDVFTVTFPAQ